MKRRNLIVIGLALVIGAQLASAQSAVDLDLQELLGRYDLAKDQVSIDFGRQLQCNPNLPLNPASTMKVLTTAAALNAMGPSYRFKTAVYVDGSLDQGVLSGSLTIKGYGDPSMVSEQLWRLVTDLRDRGLREVKGDLIGDDSYLPTTGWRDDFTRGMSSNSANGALSLNYNHIQVWVHPGAIGSAGKVMLDPAVGELITIRNQSQTVSGTGNRVQVDIDTINGRLTVTIRGTIGNRSSAVQSYKSLVDPSRYYLAAFREMFTSAGGKISGGIKLQKVPSSARLFYEKESEAYLSQILILMNKYSNNYIAEQLTMILGAMGESSGDPYDLGLKQLREIISVSGANSEGAVISSGSGLSKSGKISAAQMTAVLNWAANQPSMGPEMLASLSIFAEDGTTKKRPNEKDLGALVRAKTGSINDVVALAGYLLVPTPSGYRPVSFAILINQPGAAIDKFRPFQNALLKLAVEKYKLAH